MPIIGRIAHQTVLAWAGAMPHISRSLVLPGQAPAGKGPLSMSGLPTSLPDWRARYNEAECLGGKLSADDPLPSPHLAKQLNNCGKTAVQPKSGSSHIAHVTSFKLF
jgi:hypothetical protein